MINRKVEVVSTSGLPSGIRPGYIGVIVRLLGDDSVYDVEVKFSRNRTEYFEVHELRYLNGKRVSIRYPKKKSIVGMTLKLHRSCIYYHPDVCIVTVTHVDHKLGLITVRDSTGCAFPVYTSEVRFVNNHKVTL